MKKFFFSLLAGITLLACNNNSTKDNLTKNTDLFQQNLKGKVQSYTEESYKVDSTGNIHKDSVIYITEIDEKGYSGKNQTKDTTGTLKEETIITRNENGTPTEVTTKVNGKQIKKFILELDSNRKFSLVKVYDSTEKMSSYYKDITQNEFEEVLGATEYTPENKFKSSFTESYNNGHYAGSVGKDSSGKENYSSLFKFNDKGDWIEETEITETKDSTKTVKTTYKYDSYDDKGNWTQRTQNNDKGKPIKIVKRTFTYYKD